MSWPNFFICPLDYTHKILFHLIFPNFAHLLSAFWSFRDSLTQEHFASWNKKKKLRWMEWGVWCTIFVEKYIVNRWIDWVWPKWTHFLRTKWSKSKISPANKVHIPNRSKRPFMHAYVFPLSRSLSSHKERKDKRENWTWNLIMCAYVW